MDENILFSIVIPVYNVKPYLEKCLNTIIGQTYKNLDIVIVDDGSDDGSSFICDEFKKRDNRIRVIHKKNEGLGMARNSGLDIAIGDYISFIDSDDFISEDLFMKCYNILKNKKYDVLCFDFAIFENDKIKYSPYSSTQREYEGTEVMDYFKNSIYNKNNKLRLHDCAWNKIYSLTMLRKNKFNYVSEREFISEDYYSNLIMFKYVNSVFVMRDILYFYRVNQTSLSRRFKEDRFDKLFYQLIESEKL